MGTVCVAYQLRVVKRMFGAAWVVPEALRGGKQLPLVRATADGGTQDAKAFLGVHRNVLLDAKVLLQYMQNIPYRSCR